jgi:hypothetical protein
MGYAARVVKRRWLTRSTWQSGVAVLLLAGCRDVLGLGGYRISEPEAGIRDAGKGPRDAADERSQVIDARPPTHKADTGPAEPSTYRGKNGTIYSSAVCRDCIDVKCPDQASTCASDPACRDLSGCLALCAKSDALCRVRCNLSTRRTTPMSALTACAAVNCSDCAAAHATYAGVTCQPCLDVENAGALGAFSRNFAALELDSCRQDCPPPYRDREHCPCSDIYGPVTSVSDAGQRQVSSRAAEDAGDAEGVLKALESATKSGQCAGFCGSGQPQDWSCLDSLHAPGLPDDEQTFELNLTLIDLAFKPVVGALLRPCGVAYPNCEDEPPVAGATDSNGFAQLVFHRTVTGAGAPEFFGGIEVSWGSEDAGGPSTTLLYFTPLARSQTWTMRRLVSRDVADFNVKSVLGRKPDWEKTGGIVFSAVTCSGDPAVDVEAKLDDAGTDGGHDRVFYSNGYALDPSAQSTLNTGLGAFVEVIPKARTLTLFRYKDKDRTLRQNIGVYPLYVRAGAITTVALAPYQGPIP